MSALGGQDHYSDHVNAEEWRGGIHLKPNRPCEERNGDYLNKINLILFAGFCAQNIFNKSITDAAVEIPHYIASPDSTMDNDGISGDWDYIQRNLREPMNYYGFKYNDYEYKKYRIIVMQYIFLVLQEPMVRGFMDNVSQALISKSTLSNSEIMQLSSSTGFLQYLGENKEPLEQKYNELFKKRR